MRRSGADFQSALTNIVARRNMAWPRVYRVGSEEYRVENVAEAKEMMELMPGGRLVDMGTPTSAAPSETRRERPARPERASRSTKERDEGTGSREEEVEEVEVEEEDEAPRRRRATGAARSSSGVAAAVDGVKKPKNAYWGKRLPTSPYRRLYHTLGQMRGIVAGEVDLQMLKDEYASVREDVEKRNAQTAATRPECWRRKKSGELAIKASCRFYLPEFLFRKAGLRVSQAQLAANKLKARGLLAGYSRVPFTEAQLAEARELFERETGLALPLSFPEKYLLASGTWYHQPDAEDDSELEEFEKDDSALDEEG